MRITAAFTLFVGMATVLAGPAVAAQAKGTMKAGNPPELTVEMMREMADKARRPAAMGVSAARGELIFVELCALCHGIKGKGDGPRSAFFEETQFIPDLSDANVLAGREGEALENIRQGLRRLDDPLIVMPQFKYILSENEIQSAFAYVKTLSGKPMKK
ncbi:MAG: c-type cytochrome [Magnetospirillum sp. WYHS-4]